jgi:hypothetical protein
MWGQLTTTNGHLCIGRQSVTTWTSFGCCWTGVWAGAGALLSQPGHHALVMCTGHDPADAMLHGQARMWRERLTAQDTATFCILL